MRRARRTRVGKCAFVPSPGNDGPSPGGQSRGGRRRSKSEPLAGQSLSHLTTIDKVISVDDWARVRYLHQSEGLSELFPSRTLLIGVAQQQR